MVCPAVECASCYPLVAAAVGAAAYALLTHAGLGAPLAQAILPRQALLLLMLVSSLLRMGARKVMDRIHAAIAAWHEPPVTAATDPVDAPAPNVVMRRPRALPPMAHLPPSQLTPLTFGSAVSLPAPAPAVAAAIAPPPRAATDADIASPQVFNTKTE